jgi:myotubularin-related protein 9
VIHNFLSYLKYENLARTVIGLLSIIQREWIEAGHPFFERHQRSAWTQKNAITGQEGSTFFLFLHAIQHLLLTHPLHFEVLQILFLDFNIFQFNSSFLLRLHDIAVSSEFGNFIGDNEKERARAGVANKTYSIWPVLASEESFKNPLYGETQMKPAWPLGPSDLWRQYWCRFQRASSTQKDDIFDLQMASLKKLKTENEALKLR